MQPPGSRHLLFYELVRYARSTGTMERHVKDFLNDPFRFLVDDEGVFLFWVALVTERRVGKYPLTVCKLGVQRGFDLAAGIFRKPLISSLRIKHDKLKLRYNQQNCSRCGYPVPRDRPPGISH